MKYDFEGWATKNDLRCADGRIIRKDAFKVQNGHKVPLIWGHKHDDPDMILGHAILENRSEGVYAHCRFNNSPKALNAKELIRHGDITAMSIWANNLTQVGVDVVHGAIREVSLVVAGANPGAFVESVLYHGLSIDESDSEGIIYTGESIILCLDEPLRHSDEPEEKDKKSEDSSGKTVGEIYDALNQEQKRAVAFIVGQAIAENENDNDENEEEEEEMRHNIFESVGTSKGTQYLSHEDMIGLIGDAKRVGSLREAIQQRIEDGTLVHAAISTEGMTAGTGTQSYGVRDPELLFPDYKTISNTPEWLSRNMTWVQKVMSSVHRTPFSRIKSVYADITEDEARARGYIKGKQKKTEVFSILKRTTMPQTVYKLQKMDRDDVLDITDFDVIAWIKAEMRIMLDEEIARAILIGDGRMADSDDKIKEDRVRPIATDVPLFNIKVNIDVSQSASEEEIAKATLNGAIRGRKGYKGSGNPTFYTTEDVLTEMLLLEDKNGRKIYKTEEELSTALRVKEIVTVEPMEGMKIDDKELLGIVVNLIDYNVGADKGGEINMFDDFDLNFNKHEYLIETRISGALVKPFSALTILLNKGSSLMSRTSE